ncbi:uncharacterized protein LOC123294195 [Chrysoperla carnea]|uniref:uncharacterized protein LOC123294195 n=1 Tax=Chrysoperla carnea TaxID=189513 RepID=UPI001D060B98|nr:uncharacterized protein LOC123294195 [Chrysoperla carnea]
MLYVEVLPAITNESLTAGICKALLEYYVYLENPSSYYIEKKLKYPEDIQVYSSTRRDRRTSFRSKTIINEFADVNQPGPSGMSASGRGHVEEADWMDKLFSVKKKKIVRPTKLDDRQPSTISKKKHMSSVLRIKQRVSSRKSSRAWGEDSREQFLTKLTKESSEHRKKDYLKKTIGKHDTEVMGIQIVPLIVPNSSNEINNREITIETTKPKINIQEPLKPKQFDPKTTIKVVERKKIGN